jgi:hypothetical protein
LPAVQHPEDVGQVERLRRFGHRLPILPVEVPGLLRNKPARMASGAWARSLPDGALAIAPDMLTAYEVPTGHRRSWGLASNGADVAAGWGYQIAPMPPEVPLGHHPEHLGPAKRPGLAPQGRSRRLG